MRRRAGRALIAATLLLGAGPAVGETAQLTGSYPWAVDEAGFGGFSALELFADGTGFIAMTDKATLWSGRLERDAAGGVTAVILNGGPVALKNSEGADLTRLEDDGEGLALAPGAGFYASFEGLDRVVRYPAAGEPSQPLPRHKDFAGFATNSGPEALAIDGAGRLYLLPETPGPEGDFPVYRYDGAWTQPFAVAASEGYLAVGADFAPDGRLYLLERQFSSVFGFSSRIRRFTITGDVAGLGETLLQTAPGTHQNLEGIAIWTDAAGGLHATLISDDNFQFYLRTDFVDYRLPD